MAKKIAIDIDDVLAHTAGRLVEYGNENWGHQFALRDFTDELSWKNLWGNAEQARKSELHEAGVYRELEHHTNAYEVLTWLKQQGYELVIVTAREDILVDVTNVWLEEHFDGLFTDIRYAGVWDKNSDYFATKAELCMNLGVDFLIDDQLTHCSEAAKCGVVSLLYGDYPWNKSQHNLPRGVERVLDWTAVKEFFGERSTT